MSDPARYTIFPLVISGLVCGGPGRLNARQTFEPVRSGSVTLSGNNIDCVENRRWLAPVGKVNPKYTLNGTAGRFAWTEALKAISRLPSALVVPAAKPFQGLLIAAPRGA